MISVPDCGQPPSVSDAFWEPGSDSGGQSATLKCNEGFYLNVLTWHTYIINVTENVTENVTLLNCTHLAYIYHQCDRKCDRKL
jgi:hypothetical protein